MSSFARCLCAPSAHAQLAASLRLGDGSCGCHAALSPPAPPRARRLSRPLRPSHALEAHRPIGTSRLCGAPQAHRKADLVRYLHDLGQAWCEDASNQAPTYKRNRVRLQLVPLVEELSGGAEGLVARVGALEQQSAQLREWLQLASSAYLVDEKSWHTAQRALSISRLQAQPGPLPTLRALSPRECRALNARCAAH